jgi:hypothetical protein
MDENPDTHPFLYLVAKDLLDRIGNDLTGVKVVFPSRRARLFFNNYLYEITDKPLWAPQYTSIEELFESVSPYHNADMLQLIGDLYQTYMEVYNAKSEKPSAETLDEFFFFGEILLNDFDDVDKNLVNAELLFGNLQDLDKMKDDFSHLSENQIEAIKRFGSLFSGKSLLKTAFWSIWNILGDVYRAFRKKLELEGIAYPGMLMREVVENENICFSDKQYVFVGFNVLNKCEKTLFKHLKDKSLFYWDYDFYYLKQEAGRYIEENIRELGSALDKCGFDIFLNQKKEITFMASSSESGQSGVIPEWIDSLHRSPDFSVPDSAIVLCNESVLPVVIHAIPSDKVENVNITMGFPITQTPVAGFLQLLIELQSKAYSSGAFYYKYVLPVLRHPYTKIIFPEAEKTEQTILRENVFFPDNKILTNETLFKYARNTLDLNKYLLDCLEMLGKNYRKKQAAENVYDGLYQESIFRAYQVLNRLYGLLLSGQWRLEKTTFLRLLRKLWGTTQVPFHGEPVKGLQIMGVLETRTLDFKNIVLLNVNEGYMPGTKNDNTFIPEFLRKHFGLSTIEHQDSIYAYHFYRLIQRAEKLTLVYNTDNTQTGKAEISRFLLQMLIDPRLDIKRYTLQSAIKPYKPDPVIIPKTEDIISQIKRKYDFNTNPEAGPLTPSSMNLFIDCSLRFYLKKIKGYENPEELDDEFAASIFGTIFHHSAESLYREIGRIGDEKDFTPFVVRKENLSGYLLPDSYHLIRRIVANSFQQIYFKGRATDETQYNGEQLINFRVICKMLQRMIEFDLRQAPFTIVGLEWKNYHFYDLEDAGVKLKIGGIIDRLEEKDEKMLIVDYKTGGTAKPYKTLSDLVTEKEKRVAHVFQTFVYSSILIRKNSYHSPIVPALLYMQEAGKENYSPVIEYDGEPISDFRNLHDEFEELFLLKISDLFNSEIPFQQTPFTGNCEYCEFKELCSR